MLSACKVVNKASLAGVRVTVCITRHWREFTDLPFRIWQEHSILLALLCRSRPVASPSRSHLCPCPVARGLAWPGLPLALVNLCSLPCPSLSHQQLQFRLWETASLSLCSLTHHQFMKDAFSREKKKPLEWVYFKNSPKGYWLHNKQNGIHSVEMEVSAAICVFIICLVGNVGGFWCNIGITNKNTH